MSTQTTLQVRLLARHLLELILTSKLAEEEALNPDDFFKEWIPKKYGIPYGQKTATWVQGVDRPLTYRQACIWEIKLYFPDLKDVTIDKGWGKSFEKSPFYIPPFLAILDKWYRILEVAGNLNS
ncbi:MAG: hypothetical protein KME15_16135 [Drouetiella hepatica Uher 2000/2452]|jgi:hypothetical protein|uniref:Uncharacterized protein n=1 Tax=Drouetiella hepatica Uher 2000/2452 TaxID=904376 RepID=A0A951QCZ9_9CYAN|nr:hypothetical protein [Drouetiella hepatica Uher 2000/2452]